MNAWQWTGWDHDPSKGQELNAQWQCHDPEDFSHLQHHCENLKSGRLFVEMKAPENCFIKILLYA
jgi:hypothetical protein